MSSLKNRLTAVATATRAAQRGTRTTFNRGVHWRAATCLALMSTALLAGCASDPTDRAPTAAYRCDDGSRFTVRFDPNSASVHLASGRTITLAQQKAASGMWYLSKGYELRGKGDDATWTANGAPATECRSV